MTEPRTEQSDAANPTVIYRPYFVAGLLVILTAGATWGAYLLWRIGFEGSFTGVSVHDVNAHGQAQIFGWVGLFMMGFGYQAFPYFWRSRLVKPGLAIVALVLMLLGVVIRSLSMPAVALPGATVFALVGGLCQIIAIAIFTGQILLTFYHGQARFSPVVGFIMLALTWFVLQAIGCTWHTWMLMTASSREAMLWYVATYQAPLRDIQIHGLALFMILGVSMHQLPRWFRLPRTPHRIAWIALVLMTVAVILEALAFIAWRWTEQQALAGLLPLAWLMLTVGVMMIILPWRLWKPTAKRDRTLKFIRAGYAWLVVSLLMLLLLPVYQWISGIAFSHAYYGAIRHAITVGFISMMIMGVSVKVVPMFRGVAMDRLTPLWGPFILVNTGCLLRVSLQTLTDWHDLFFMLVGISGVLEVMGLALWAGHLLTLIYHSKWARQQPIYSRQPAPA